MLKQLKNSIQTIFTDLQKTNNKYPKQEEVLEKLRKQKQHSKQPLRELQKNIAIFYEKISNNRNMNKCLPFIKNNIIVKEQKEKEEKEEQEKLSQNLAAQQKAETQQYHKKPQKKIKLNDELYDKFPSINDLGGIEKNVQALNELVYMPIKHENIFKALNQPAPKGVLISGTPGSGKSVLAIAICKDVKEKHGYNFFIKSGTELIGGISGESENNLRNLFNAAVENAPSVIFIDEIDSIAGKRENANKDMERRVTTQLLQCLDSLPSNVFVLTATSKPELLDPALRRSGRIDREIVLQVPDESVREQILEKILKDTPLSEDFNLKSLIKSTPGYVPADLNSLAQEAGLFAVKRIIADEQKLKIEETTNVDQEINDVEKNEIDKIQAENNEVAQETKLQLEQQDFDEALKMIKPTAQREGFSIIPDTSWEDIGSLNQLKEELENTIQLPILQPELFTNFNIQAPAGILLYGPPGCGKTLLAKAVANSSAANFIAIKGPELLNKYVGESERSVRQVFQRARFSSPCIIFFDELDALCPKRGMRSDSSQSSERVVNQLLTEMDGIDSRKQVYIIAATNRPDIIDPAMLRPGRLDKILYVPIPQQNDRLDILKTLLRKTPCEDDINLEELAADLQTKNFTGADLSALVKEACLLAILAKDSKLNKIHFESALKKITPSLQEKEISKYEKLQTVINKKQALLD